MPRMLHGFRSMGFRFFRDKQFAKMCTMETGLVVIRMREKIIHSILSFFTNAELKKQLEMRKQMK